MRHRLFDVDARPRRRGTSTELVPVERDRCLDCGGTLHTVTADEPALFRHGGYGATRTSHTVICAALCGWALTVDTTETNPRWTP